MQTVNKTEKQANNPGRGVIADTPAVLNDLYKQSAHCGQVCCGWLHSRALPPSMKSLISETLVLAIAIPESIRFDWGSQTEDWLIPYNETDYVQQHATRLMMLGNGPLAVEMDLAWHAFYGTDDSVFVLYVGGPGTRIVRYSWNERFLYTLDALYKTAGANYVHDEEDAEYALSIGKPVHGCSQAPAVLPAEYFAIDDNGRLMDCQVSRRPRQAD
ncbi:hypothetical protein SAMN05445504_7614 [Burkholderia sp. CF099]|nr:hypothetical protein SAMN05445504_7614 [Burkholderia sp. CF099]